MITRREFLQVIPALIVAFKRLVSDNILEPSIVQSASGFPITFDLQFPDAATVAMEEARHKMYLPRFVFNSVIQASDCATFNGLQEQITTGFAPDFEPVITIRE